MITSSPDNFLKLRILLLNSFPSKLGIEVRKHLNKGIRAKDSTLHTIFWSPTRLSLKLTWKSHKGLVLRKRWPGIGFYIANDFWIGEFLKTRSELSTDYDEVVFASSFTGFLSQHLFRKLGFPHPHTHSLWGWGQIWNKNQERTELLCKGVDFFKHEEWRVLKKKIPVSA